MGNIFNEDFQDFIQSLHLFDVEYVLVGGYSVILHGYSRTTGDMDIWVNKTETNYRKLQKAFLNFGLGMFDMTLDNFLYNEEIDVFTFGRPPVSIDVMTSVKGLNFQDTFQEAIITEVDGITLRLIHYNHLVMAKKASNRPKDQDDLENLKSN